MYTTAGVNVNNVQAAKQRFTSAITGLILGLSVILILEAINLDLRNPTCALRFVGGGTDVFENLTFGGASSNSSSGSGNASVVTAGSFASGIYTGPAATIGSGSAYHIDSKFPKTMSWEQIDAYFLAMAEGYAANNRRIEFSNRAVTGQVYDPNAPQSDRIAMLQRAAAAHAPRSLHSFDYYVPLNGTDRWSSSVEDVEMILPSVPGGRVDYASGGRYGYYVRVYDADGNFVYITGHGNDTKPLPEDITF